MARETAAAASLGKPIELIGMSGIGEISACEEGFLRSIARAEERAKIKSTRFQPERQGRALRGKSRV